MRLLSFAVAVLLLFAGQAESGEPVAAGSAQAESGVARVPMNRDTPSELSVTPQTVSLRGKESTQRLIVTGLVAGQAVDQTRNAAFTSETPNVVRIDSHGVVTAVGDGTGTITASVGSTTARATIRVTGAAQYLPVNLELDVVPILTATGCNAGACHGKARGQNGFELSLLGFYPAFDYASLLHDGRGRRIFPGAPDESLLLRKPAGLVPHGGGKRLAFDGPQYNLLRRWIAAGTPRRTESDPLLVRIVIDPPDRIMGNNASQQLLVTAHFSDGSTRDVTDTSAYQSNESAIALVDAHGLVTAGPIPGEAAIMARYMDQIATFNVTIPLAGSVPPEFYATLPRQNFVDGHVWNKLQRLQITPSAPAGDSTFLRRAFTDIIGRLPTPEECRTFFASTSPAKRSELVDYLLQQPEYADYWANKWTDLLLPNPYRVGIKATINNDAWIRESFRENKPYDQFVRELITAQGSTWRNGAATLFRDRREPDEITTIVSQLFLGVRLECAKCHHHPFEKWGQEHFFGFASYFSRVGRKGQGISTPISGGEETIFTAKSGRVTHPLTGEVLQPSPLFGHAPEIDSETDPREALAAWITSADNPFFVQVIANRVWADLMGRGLVEPVDDLRDTNPPSNGPLLKALGEDFRKQGFDLKKLIRTIATAYVYGLSSLPGDRNVSDTRNYSRHYRKRLRAETLLDSASAITGIPESFAAMPPQSRAMQLWTRRIDSAFLDSFGRPDLNQDPPCERTLDTTMVQTLHLMNAPRLHQKVIDDKGRAAELAAGTKSPREIVEEIYLLVYSRFPTEAELPVALDLFEKRESGRRAAAEDLLWALLNTPEFVIQD